MFNFNGGDILVIFLAIIAFLLYHRLFNRNVVTIDKARNYIDGRKNEINQYFSTQMEIIDSKQEAFQKALRHAEDMQYQLARQAEDSESSIRHIEEYHNGLNELNVQAEAVEENLKRLQTESSYIDDLGLNISSLKDKFTTLAQKDKERFDSFCTHTLKAFDGKIHEIESKLSTARNDMDNFHKSLEKTETLQKKTSANQLNAFREELLKVENEFSERLKKLTATGHQLETKVFNALEEKITSDSAELEVKWNTRLENVANGISTAASDLDKTLENMRLKSHNTEKKFSAHLKKLSEAGRQIESNVFNSLKKKITSDSGELEVKWNQRLEELAENISTTVSGLSNTLENMRLESQSTENDFQNFEKRIQNSMINLETQIRDNTAEFEHKTNELYSHIQQYAEDKENEFLQKIEDEQVHYRDILDKKFEDIEQSITNIVNIHETLKDSQQKHIDKNEALFREFDDKMALRRQDEEKIIEQRVSELREQMQNLETEMNQLKTEASSAVSEKMQRVKDELFADLDGQDEEMRREFEEWRSSYANEIQNFLKQSIREREKMEKNHSEELEMTLSEYKNTVAAQYDTFNQQLSNFRDSLKEQVNSSEEQFDLLKNTLENRIAQQIQQSSEQFEQEANDKLQSVRLSQEESLSQLFGNYSHQYQELSDFRDSLEEQLSANEEQFDLMKITFEDRLTQQVNQSSEQFQQESDGKLQNIRLSLEEQITELMEDYSTQSQQLMSGLDEKNTTLVAGIKYLEEKLDSVSEAFDQKKRNTLDELNSLSKESLFDIQKNAKNIKEDIEQKIRNLQQSVQNAEKRIEVNRKKSIAYIEDEYSRLTKNLNDMDKRQGQILQEVNSEKVDEVLQMIAKLRKQIIDVQDEGEQIGQINEQCEHTLALYERIEEKATLFFNEKARIEHLEGRINYIHDLSDSIENTLNVLSKDSSNLKNIQLQLDNMKSSKEELQKDYRNLSKDITVLQQFNLSVDQSIRRITEIDSQLSQVDVQMEPLQTVIAEIKDKQMILYRNRDDVDAIIEKVSSLDDIISNMDTRLENMKKIQEWVAQTETRVNQVYTRIQQQAALTDKLTAGKNRAGDSITQSERDFVVQLSQEGFDTKAIANRTGFSQSEIELILETTSSRR